MSPLLIFLAVVVVAVVAIIALAVFTVDQQSVAIVERFGKFARISNSGLNFKIPLVETIPGILSLRIQQMDVTIETKTKDNVFVNVIVSVQYHALEAKIYEAFYKLTNPKQQIQSYVFDVVRAQVPKMNLDDVFEKKDDIADAVKKELSEVMEAFGYSIVKALVTDVDPDANVKAAMNEINQQQRLRMAAQEKGEADKILRVKQAEAEAESMRLNGQGIADQRTAIIAGLKQSVDEFQKTVEGTDPLDVMSLVMMSQYYDTLKEIGANDKSHTILLPTNPEGMKNFASQFRDSMITANLAVEQAKTQ